MNKPTCFAKKSILGLLLFLGFFTGASLQSQTEIDKQYLGNSTPEAEGVASEGIVQFLDAVEMGENELHSLVILRHGKIISEAWWSPYGKDLRHVMFSVSKSFTSIGVGIAISENKLKLTDKVYTFFPQSLPDTLSANMKEMTVQHLLTMSTGMNADPLYKARTAKNWPLLFLSSPVENKPGSVFIYNNMATFMLSAIVQKATGQKLVDYLKPRLFDPLNITNYKWDDTPEGYTLGAIGLKITSHDMAKFGQLMLQKGNWQGKQLVPSSWVEAATSFQIQGNAPENPTPKEFNDWEQGYGYQFWRGREKSFRADGLGGQFIVVLPEKDAVVVLTAAASNTQKELDLVWKYLVPAMQDKALPENKKAQANLKNRIDVLSGERLVERPSKLAKKISGKHIEVSKNEAGISGLSIYIDGADNMSLKIFHGNEVSEMKADYGDWELSNTLLKSLVGSSTNNSAGPYKVASMYDWINDTSMNISFRFLEESIRQENLILRFEEVGDVINVNIELINHVEFVGKKSIEIKGKVL
jgi:CubicO group peptidase (beta-lactamase class C family)